MINCNGISKSFKSDFWAPSNIVLKDVTFKLRDGVITGFLGANGAGKTTTVKIIMSFINADCGEVIFDEKLGRSQKEIKSNIGYLPEHPYFYPHLSGREFVRYLLELNGTLVSEYFNNLEGLAKRLRIDHALDKPLRSYSKGMLQRIGFICAIIHDPLLIILDEPLSGVDPVGRSIIKKMMIELSQTGKSIFFSSHIVSDLEEICDDVVFLDGGRVSFSGSKKDLVSKSTERTDIEFINKENKVEIITIETKSLNHKLSALCNEGITIKRVLPNSLSLEEAVYREKNSEVDNNC